MIGDLNDASLILAGQVAYFLRSAIRKSKQNQIVFLLQRTGLYKSKLIFHSAVSITHLLIKYCKPENDRNV